MNRKKIRPAASGPSSFRLFNADAIEWLQAFESESVDLVVTDPPYESLEKHRARGTTTRLKKSKSSSNPWFPIFPNSRLKTLFAELFRVLRKNSHLYIFCDQETAFLAKPAGEQCGFKFWKPLVWDKRSIGMGYHYRSRYEFILFFEKGRRKLKDLGVSDIISEPRIHGGYPTEKPTAISKLLIAQSSEADALVIDPFVGSGSVGEAAVNLGRRFLGCDILPEAVQIARQRLRANSFKVE